MNTPFQAFGIVLRGARGAEFQGWKLTAALGLLLFSGGYICQLEMVHEAPVRS